MERGRDGRLTRSALAGDEDRFGTLRGGKNFGEEELHRARSPHEAGERPSRSGERPAERPDLLVERSDRFGVQDRERHRNIVTRAIGERIPKRSWRAPGWFRPVRGPISAGTASARED